MLDCRKLKLESETTDQGEGRWAAPRPHGERGAGMTQTLIPGVLGPGADVNARPSPSLSLAMHTYSNFHICVERGFWLYMLFYNLLMNSVL